MSNSIRSKERKNLPMGAPKQVEEATPRYILHGSSKSGYANPDPNDPVAMAAVPRASVRGQQEGRPPVTAVKVTGVTVDLEEAVRRADIRAAGGDPLASPVEQAIEAVSPSSAESTSKDFDPFAAGTTATNSNKHYSDTIKVDLKLNGMTVQVEALDLIDCDYGVMLLFEKDGVKVRPEPATPVTITVPGMTMKYECFFPGLIFDIEAVNLSAMVFIGSSNGKA